MLEKKQYKPIIYKNFTVENEINQEKKGMISRIGFWETQITQIAYKKII
jgi:hypothetical protein